MPLVVDTYNVLHTVGVLPPDLAGIGIAGLVGLLERSRYGRQPTWLYCDGGPRKAGHQKPTRFITVAFAGPDRQADTMIADAVARSTTPRCLTVVSTDGQVRKTARKRRCPLLRSDEFLGHLLTDYRGSASGGRGGAHPSPPTEPLGADEIAHWVKTFNLSDLLLHVPASTWPPTESSTDGPPPGHPREHQPPDRTHPTTDAKSPAITQIGLPFSEAILKEAAALIACNHAPVSAERPETPAPSRVTASESPRQGSSAKRRTRDRHSMDQTGDRDDQPQEDGQRADGQRDDALDMHRLFPDVRPLEDDS